MGRGTLHKTGPHASAVVLALVAVSSSGGGLGCARVDLREWLPAASLRDDQPPAPHDVAVAVSALGELPGPPSLESGAASLLPEPLGSMFSSVPLLGSAGAQERPGWLVQARRKVPLGAVLVESLLGPMARTLERSSRWYALSDDAAAVLDARAQGVAAVLVVRVSAGPDDAQTPWPAGVVVAAEVALLSTDDGHTLARAYERVGVPVRLASEAGVHAALRQGASRLGRALGASMHLRGWAWMGPGDEEKDAPTDSD